MAVDSDQDMAELLQRGFRYALSLTHDESRAEDLLQDAWVAVLAAGGTSSKGYLYAGIRSRFIDRYRRERLVVIESLDAEVGAALQARAPDEAILADVASLERALGSLRAEEREALYLSAAEGYSAGEIAALTGRPRGTVLSLIHRGRQKLLRLLAAGNVGAQR
ncbi:MAG: RNA polymerase sigma factor [Candidatus Schekmanbacteria bacterium]|nr:RNA polymerase sigma factor [Candidatus Schekmanbacteria bacterium]